MDNEKSTLAAKKTTPVYTPAVRVKAMHMFIMEERGRYSGRKISEWNVNLSAIRNLLPDHVEGRATGMVDEYYSHFLNETRGVIVDNVCFCIVCDKYTEDDWSQEDYKTFPHLDVHNREEERKSQQAAVEQEKKSYEKKRRLERKLAFVREERKQYHENRIKTVSIINGLNVNMVSGLLKSRAVALVNNLYDHFLPETREEIVRKLCHIIVNAEFDEWWLTNEDEDYDRLDEKNRKSEENKGLKRTINETEGHRDWNDSRECIVLVKRAHHNATVSVSGIWGPYESPEKAAEFASSCEQTCITTNCDRHMFYIKRLKTSGNFVQHIDFA